MAKSLSYLSDVATQETNTTGTTTPILRFDPEDGTYIKIRNAVAKGDEIGVPVYMDLQDSSGNNLPVDTALILRVKRPTDDEPVAVSVKEDNIAAWNGLSVSEQRNEENIDQTKLSLKGDAVNFRDVDEARVEINTTTQIDWSNSELYIDRAAVSVHDKEA